MWWLYYLKKYLRINRSYYEAWVIRNEATPHFQVPRNEATPWFWGTRNGATSSFSVTTITRIFQFLPFLSLFLKQYEKKPIMSFWLSKWPSKTFVKTILMTESLLITTFNLNISLSKPWNVLKLILKHGFLSAMWQFYKHSISHNIAGYSSRKEEIFFTHK